MATHATRAAAPVTRHRTGTASWAIPLALGAVFGFYAGFLHRTGTVVGWGDVLFGVVAGLILAALAYGLGRIQHSMPRELRAFAYASLCGIAIGFLHSLTGTSILRSAGMGLMFAAAMLVVSFYVFYTHE
ncbi:hypothetical protein [Streptomyces clavuligerus]|nr:hypothetical protein [Streptomyces clavuligerus]ANW19349.1 hypothetical protein BB341_14530 [Streptomyces clavuligerus]AXU13952.1 hypothetical protein D1794_15145 [Streptomyces clavuligerus]EDY50714.1 conserved hypothetical protein [Streptomyces clavuligerus]MBY6303922.1 hypothetical protein [Streptomyces clavuligerus]QCS06726.1 hypothetical protein CRV15_14495 [Streptomyces clavuligerus]